MSETVASLLVKFYDRYPDAKTSGDTRALGLLNDVDADLCSRLNLRPTDFPILLTAGTREYSMDALDVGGVTGDKIVRIYSAELVRSTLQGDAKALMEESVAAMNIKWRNWRNAPPNEPSRYYVMGRSFGLYPTPDTSSASSGPEDGFPYVLLQASVKDVMAGGDSLPATIQDSLGYLAGMCFRYALINDKAAAAGWSALYDMEQRRMLGYLNGFIEPKNDQLLAGYLPKLGIR